MPFFIILIGIFLFVSALRGTTQKLAGLLVGDLTGQGSFLYWLVAVFVIGALGYVKALKGLSDAFLVLIILVLFISRKGFFAQFNAALKQVASTSVATNSGSPMSGLNSTVPSLSAPNFGLSYQG